MKPLFITFEGLDGSGKSFHLKQTARRLEQAGVPVCVTHEPGGTVLGEGIRSLFLDPATGSMDGRVELLMVFASRRQHLEEVIDPGLRAGKHVLCDRFTDSTIAYQGFGRGVPLDVIAEVDRLATGNRVPDRTVLMDLPAELARERGRSPSRRGRKPSEGGVDRFDEEELDFYRRVREGYGELAGREPERFRVVSTARDREEAAADVEAALADLLGPARELGDQAS